MANVHDAVAPDTVAIAWLFVEGNECMRSSLLEHSSYWNIQNEMAVKPESDKATAAASIISFLWEPSCYDLNSSRSRLIMASATFL